MAIQSVEKFLGLTDLPLYNREAGWCKTLTNWRVRPGGYLEQRGGFDEIKPSGGTASDPISAGIFTGAHEHTMADGYIFTAGTGGTVFSANLAQRAHFEIWSSTVEAQHDAIYIGSTVGQFSRAVLYIGQALVSGGAAQTFTYEYPKAAAWDTDGNAATSGTLTTTSTPTFTATGEQTLEAAIPSDAVKAVRNGIYGWWFRIRLSAVGGGITTACRQGATANTLPSQKVYVDWPGAREIYVASANSASGTDNGTLKYYGQTSATDASWNSVSTSLFSGNYPRVRFASYRNLLYFVNGKDQKRWDGNTLANIGFTAPDLTTTAATAVVGAGTALGDGVWLYAMTYGYGPAGEWGESSSTAIGTAATTVSGGPATDAVRLEWAFNTTPGTDVDAIYIYRTPNLASTQASGQAAFPYYRIKTFYRNSAGTLPSGTGASGPHTDETLALPFPPVDLDIATRTPPSRCKYIGVHKNRLFLGGNNQYPGRVWWAQPFQSEAFNTDEDFADFTRSTGGILTGMIEFNDQMVVMTEDQMFGIANVDQDIPSIYVIHPSVGCIAPDSLRTGYGSLMWAARDGIYRWTGEGQPENISNDIYALQKMSSESHGGARGVIHSQMYDIYFITSGNTELTAPRYRYDLVTGAWNTVTIGAANKKWAPLANVTAPLAHADAGVRHALYGQAALSGTDYGVFLAEMTNQDDGSNFTCTAEVLLGPRGDKLYTVRSVAANYFAGTSSSFGSITLDFGGNSTAIGYPIVAGTSTTDGSDDYSRVFCSATSRSTGTGDLLARIAAVTQSATVTIPARLLAFHLYADEKEGRRR